MVAARAKAAVVLSRDLRILVLLLVSIGPPAATGVLGWTKRNLVSRSDTWRRGRIQFFRKLRAMRKF
jgi:hypothetical protein